MEDHHRAIQGFPGYRVTRDGEVQSCRRRGDHEDPTPNWRRLAPTRRGQGYLTVNLHAAGVKVARYVHHLVLEAFIGPRPTGLICCHGDGNPANNRVQNLRWDTYQSNSDDMLRHGTRPMGSQVNAKLVEAEVLEIRRLRSGGARPRDLAADFGVSRQNVEAIVHRRSWRHLP